MAATGSDAQGSGAVPGRRGRRHRGAVGDDDDDDDLASSAEKADPESTADKGPLPSAAQGPETYEETLETVRYIVGRIFEVMGSAMDGPWGEVAEKRVVLTTDYSGSGSAELAMAFLEERPSSLCDVKIVGRLHVVTSAESAVRKFDWLTGFCFLIPPFGTVCVMSVCVYVSPPLGTFGSQEALQHHGKLTAAVDSDPPFCEHWRACDIDECCRFVLSSHPKTSKPLHVMGDMMDRLPGHARDELTHLLDLHRAEFDEKKVGLAKKEEARALLTEIGGRFLKQANDAMADVAFSQTAYCYECEQNCDVHPPPELRAKRRYINCGGNTCTPWSALGGGLRWLHPCSLPFLVWIHDLMAVLPDILVQECTSRFQQQALQEMMGMKYAVFPVTFSPVQLGIPVRRQRQYVLAIRKDQLMFGIPWVPPVLDKVFYRTLCATARVFFRAPKSMIAQHAADMAQKAKMEKPSPKATLKATDFEKYLSAGDQQRKTGHLAKAARAGVEFACVNISQSPTFYDCDARVPCLTTRTSTIWGADLAEDDGDGRRRSKEKINRPLIPYERLAAHGFPVLLSRRHAFTELLPSCFNAGQVLTRSPQSLHSSKVVLQTGNGMCVAQVGLALAVAVLGVWPRSTYERMHAHGPNPLLRVVPAHVLKQAVAAMAQHGSQGASSTQAAPSAASTLVADVGDDSGDDDGHGDGEGQQAIKRQRFA